MAFPEIERHILEELYREGDRDDLIAEICSLTRLDWDQAAALVEGVRARNESSIARRRFPLLLALALVIFIGGLSLTGYGLYGLYLVFIGAGGIPDDLTTFFMPVIEEGLDPVRAMGPALPLYLRLFVYFVFSPISATLIGIAMLYGSLQGMRRVWASMFQEKSA